MITLILCDKDRILTDADRGIDHDSESEQGTSSRNGPNKLGLGAKGLADMRKAVGQAEPLGERSARSLSLLRLLFR